MFQRLILQLFCSQRFKSVQIMLKHDGKCCFTFSHGLNYSNDVEVLVEMSVLVSPEHMCVIICTPVCVSVCMQRQRNNYSIGFHLLQYRCTLTPAHNGRGGQSRLLGPGLEWQQAEHCQKGSKGPLFMRFVSTL